MRSGGPGDAALPPARGVLTLKLLKIRVFYVFHAEGDALARDHVRLNDVALFAHLGVSSAEREVGQRIHLDLELTVDLGPASRSDAVADTVNYEAVYRTVQEVVGITRHKLLETLAGDLMNRLFQEYPAERIRIRIRKPNVPFSGSLASAEIEMVRDRA